MKTQDQSFYIALDAEWQSDTGAPLTVQLAIEHGPVYIFADNSIQALDIPRGISEPCRELGATLVWADLAGGNFDCLKYVIEHEKLPKYLRLLMFYSPKDLWLMHGWENFEKLIKPGKFPKELIETGSFPVGELTQRRNISGTYKLGKHSITVRDLKGWISSGGLADLAASVSVPFPEKNLMDTYKLDMTRGLRELPHEFIKYAIADTRRLFDIYHAFTDGYVKVESTHLSLPTERLYTEATIPMTTGSIVAKTVEKCLEECVGDPIVVGVVYRKLGELDLSSRSLMMERAVRDSVLKRVRSVADLVNDTNPEETDEFLRAEYRSKAYTLSTPARFGSDTRTTAAHLAVVQGGRAVNEIPHEFRLTNVLDADLSGAYATAMCSLTYPIGRPRIESFTGNQKRINLKDALHIIANATPGAWMIVISGKLPSAQDLIMSSLVTAREINQAMAAGDVQDYGNSDDDISKIPCDFACLHREIVNGVITARMWEIIEKTASNAELKAWHKLEVVTMAYHLEADKYTDFTEWCDAVLQHQGEVKTVHGEVRDTRTHAWFALPLANIFGKLQDARGKLKKRAKELKAQLANGSASGALSEAEYHALDAEQNALKLFINTGYGVIVSPWFDIGNVIVGNNITAMVRAAAWLMAKALRCPQIITDGGLFTPVRVRYLKKLDGKLPSLAALASPDTLDKHRNVRLAPLGSLTNPQVSDQTDVWVDAFAQAKASPSRTIDIFNALQAERLTSEHINAFWKPWGLTLGFNIELKTGHEALSAAYLGKADYVLHLTSGELVYKLRGAKQHQSPALRLHPKFEVLRRLVENTDKVGDIPLDYEHTGFLKLGIYQQASASDGYAYLDGVRPGEEYCQTRIWKLNNTGIQLDTSDDQRTIKRRGHRPSADGLFERYLSHGWQYTLGRMLTNRLTDNAYRTAPTDK